MFIFFFTKKKCRNEKIKQLKLEIKNLIKEQKDELARIKVIF